MAKSHKIKNIIKSTEKTAVITKAMQIVSASKLPGCLERFHRAKPYADLALKIIEHYTELGSHPYFKPKKTVKNIGIIIISSDRGLCGNLNLQLFKQVLALLETYQQQNQQVKLAIIGQKAHQFFGNYCEVAGVCQNLGNQPTLADIMPAIRPLLNDYDQQKIDEIYIASNTFVNTLVQKSNITPLLPLPLPTEKNKYPPDYQYEPSITSVIDKLITDYTESIIFRKLVENIACEQAARMMAMKNATENANEIIFDLNLTYNKVRQAMITQEIAEISAGANQSSGE